MYGSSYQHPVAFVNGDLGRAESGPDRRRGRRQLVALALERRREKRESCSRSATATKGSSSDIAAAWQPCRWRRPTSSETLITKAPMGQQQFVATLVHKRRVARRERSWPSKGPRVVEQFEGHFADAAAMSVAPKGDVLAFAGSPSSMGRASPTTQERLNRFFIGALPLSASSRQSTTPLAC